MGLAVFADLVESRKIGGTDCLEDRFLVMDFLSRFIDQLRQRFLSSPAPRRVNRLRVTNVSRSIQLADRIEVANSSRSRSKGLLGRDGLAAGEGLWIIPCESVHTFGMRFSIDLVYLDRQLRVRKARRQVRPWRLSACFTAHSVIELAAGTLDGKNVQRGDLISFSPLDPEPEG